jgi:hypothetical protein
MHGKNNIKVHPLYSYVRLSVCIEKLDSSWTDFYEIFYFSIFRKYVEKMEVCFHFYFRLMHPKQYTCNSLLFRHISFKISLKLIKTMAKTFVDHLSIPTCFGQWCPSSGSYPPWGWTPLSETCSSRKIVNKSYSHSFN